MNSGYLCFGCADPNSLHRLIVFNGKIQCETPEYISFNRTYADRWGQIQTVLLLIEKVLSDFDGLNYCTHFLTL